MWRLLAVLMWTWPSAQAFASDAAECPPIEELEVIKSVVIEDQVAEAVPPILRWEIVEAPGNGIIENIAGTVERLTPDAGWVQLTDGEEVPADSRLWIHPDASLVVRFSDSEYIEFNAAPGDRWVMLEAQ
jgi:hypothetical protein